MKALTVLAAARHLGVALVAAIVFAALSATTLSPVLAIATTLSHPVRPVGSYEVGAAVLAAILPSLTRPPAGPLERLAAPRARRVGLALTAALLAVCALPGLAWMGVVRAARGADVSAWHVVGEGWSMAAVGLLCYLLCGAWLGPLVALAIFVGAPFGQHMWPGSLLDLAFTHGRRNDAHPLAVAALCAIALAWWWQRRGLSLIGE